MLANISYKISAFVDLAHVEAEPKNVIEFLQEFSEYGMMPAVADGSDLGSVKRPKFTFAIENVKSVCLYSKQTAGQN